MKKYFLFCFVFLLIFSCGKSVENDLLWEKAIECEKGHKKREPSNITVFMDEVFNKEKKILNANYKLSDSGKYEFTGGDNNGKKIEKDDPVLVRFNKMFNEKDHREGFFTGNVHSTVKRRGKTKVFNNRKTICYKFENLDDGVKIKMKQNGSCWIDAESGLIYLLDYKIKPVNFFIDLFSDSEVKVEFKYDDRNKLIEVYNTGNIVVNFILFKAKSSMNIKYLDFTDK